MQGRVKINNPFSYVLVVLHVRRYIKSTIKSNKINFKSELSGNRRVKDGYKVYISDGEPIHVSMDDIYGRKLD